MPPPTPRIGDRHTGATAPGGEPAVPHGSRIAGLDGLRAIAVTAVLLFHADLYWARGGFLGVDLFFVLSGFLITGLMADEVAQSGRLDLIDFYWRRAKRLLPAAWLMMAAATLAAALIAVDALPRLRGDVLASLLYVTNWELLATDTSYFESTGRQPLLQHLWSLAIEEQFYIAWALLLPFGLRRMSRGVVAAGTLLLAAASAAWMYALATRMGDPGQADASRLYFGTDTHGFPLLLGAALGLVWRPRHATRSLHVAVRVLGVIAGALALAAMLGLFARLGEQTQWLYPQGFLLAAASSLALIVLVSHPGLALGRWLDCAPMRWVGARSYGIYLWHWPVFMLTRPGIDFPTVDARVMLALRFALSIGLAALSYRFVEQPIRSGLLERIHRDWRNGSKRGHAAVRATGVAVVLVTIFAAPGCVLWNAPTHVEPTQDVRDALSPAPPVVDAQPATDAPAAPRAPVAMPVEPPTAAPAASSAGAAPQDAPPDAAPVESFTGKDLTAVGDSVLLGSSQLLGITLHGVDVHATMGWQAADVLKQLRALREAGTIRPVALVHLGTNGYVYEAQLRQILDTLKDCRRVVLVNTHVPRRWMEANNLLIDRVAPEFANVVVARWNDVSDGEPDYFVSDGIHLTDRGQRAFIANVMRVGHLHPDDAQTVNPASIDPAKDYSSGDGDLSPTLVLAPRAAPADAYWQKLARCETDADWSHVGTKAGGLSITLVDWTRWGGLEFAATPDAATPAQQIAVANRLSTQGWVQPDGVTVAPVGFARWRCVVALPPPRPASGLPLTYTQESVLAQAFHLGERGQVVRDLQRILGTPPHGIYSKQTRAKHVAYLQANGLPESLAGADD